MNAKIQKIVKEAEAKGLAFVEDDYVDGIEGDLEWAPTVDNVGAIQWLEQQLMSLK